MRIAQSEVRLSSSHQASHRETLQEAGNTSFRTVLAGIGQPAQGESEVSAEKVQLMLQRLVQAILDALQGKDCRSVVEDCRDLKSPGKEQPQRREIEWHRQARETVDEQELTRVEGTGLVKTADGREIQLGFSVAMERQAHYEQLVSESGKIVLKDPLVLNFPGNFTQLTTNRIQFDLDGDGLRERIPGLGSGSAYLIIDRNGNGRVDDGSEMFGTTSGDGFGDLARLDSDGNGWLDEGDRDFSRLALWDGYGQGAGSIASLAERGVGALYLASVDSPFTLKNAAADVLGQIREAGFFLMEDGRPGTLQQVDLAVSSDAAEGVQKPDQGKALTA